METHYVVTVFAPVRACRELTCVRIAMTVQARLERRMIVGSLTRGGMAFCASDRFMSAGKSVMRIPMARHCEGGWLPPLIGMTRATLSPIGTGQKLTMMLILM